MYSETIPRQGQTTMIFIVLIIIIFLGMGVFLLSLAQTVSQSEYINLYTHNLLSSLVKTDTGYTDASCKTVADLLSCSFLSPTHICGTQDCFSLSEQTVNSYMEQFAFIKEGFRYLLIVESVGFTALRSLLVLVFEGMWQTSLIPIRFLLKRRISGERVR